MVRNPRKARQVKILGRKTTHSQSKMMKALLANARRESIRSRSVVRQRKLKKLQRKRRRMLRKRRDVTESLHMMLLRKALMRPPLPRARRRKDEMVRLKR